MITTNKQGNVTDLFLGKHKKSLHLKIFQNAQHKTNIIYNHKHRSTFRIELYEYYRFS
jgi:hypothetical protein